MSPEIYSQAMTLALMGWEPMYSRMIRSKDKDLHYYILRPVNDYYDVCTISVIDEVVAIGMTLPEIGGLKLEPVDWTTVPEKIITWLYAQQVLRATP